MRMRWTSLNYSVRTRRHYPSRRYKLRWASQRERKAQVRNRAESRTSDARRLINRTHHKPVAQQHAPTERRDRRQKWTSRLHHSAAQATRSCSMHRVRKKQSQLTDERWTSDDTCRATRVNYGGPPGASPCSRAVVTRWRKFRKVPIYTLPPSLRTATATTSDPVKWHATRSAGVTRRDLHFHSTPLHYSLDLIDLHRSSSIRRWSISPYDDVTIV